MMNTPPISQLMDNLPKRSITTMMLGALDFAVPGQWENNHNFAEFVKKVTGETREGRLGAIANHADQLYNEAQIGCQHAVWLYQTADSSDSLLAAAALAHQVGEKIGFLSFLSRVTPKAETVQCLDLALKLTVEALAYLMIHGLKPEQVSEFAQSLERCGNEKKMRMAALVCVDGILPLGPEFLDKIASVLKKTDSSGLEGNSLFGRIGHLLPGSDSSDRLGFIRKIFEQTQSWLQNFQLSRSLSPSAIAGGLHQVIEASQGKTEFLASFLDLTTTYMSHTGIQSVARHIIVKSAERFQPQT